MSECPKRPVEFYGEAVTTGAGAALRRALRSQQCPFLGRRCAKPRKSDPGQTIGSCILGLTRGPLVICPHRLLERDQVFLDCVSLLRPGLHYRIVPEITVPGGSVDYMLVGTREGEVVDYAGIELQSLDTTNSGAIWDAREDVRKGTVAESYGYGINWKMSAKTILVQMHHKALTFEALQRKLVLAVQDRFFDYMARVFDTGGMRDADPRDPLHLHIYSLVSLGGKLRLSLTARKSTDVRGVERMLNLGSDAGVTDEEIIRRIRAKLDRARDLAV